MSAVLSYTNDSGIIPHRKPLPQSYPPTSSMIDPIYGSSMNNSHLRTPSINYQPSGSDTVTMFNTATQRTSPDVATFSLTSTPSINQSYNRTISSGSSLSNVRRSTSSRSHNPAQAMSYVARLRIQKATVWCDSAQQEDPLLLAQQKQAKLRANAAVVGGSNISQLVPGSSAVRGKIRHHGAIKPGTFQAAVFGVPLRLSATEVDDGDDELDKQQHSRLQHRNGSSPRSSFSSADHRASLGMPSQSHLNSLAGGNSTRNQPIGNSTSPQRMSYTSGPAPKENPEIAPSMTSSNNSLTVPPKINSNSDFFDRPPSTTPTGNSGDSSSSDERNFGDVSTMPQKQTADFEQEFRNKPTADELRRRGSVDDRGIGNGVGRLFVANPDLSD